MSRKPDNFLGFTLIELMVTVSIAAILLGMAVPSFNSAITSNRLTGNANQLIAALNLARSEAIKRGLQVTIRRKGATSQAWENGWDIFVDIAGTPTGNTIGTFLDDADTNTCEFDPTSGAPIEDCLIKTYDTLPPGFTLRTGANYNDWVAYLPSGITSASGTGNADTFRLCDSTATTSNSRAIAIWTTGRARVSSSAASCP